jgi:hypothetical protein
MREFMSPQGTITPAMFIGMGGTGSRIVDRISARAAHLPNWNSQLRALTSFVALDTNINDLNKLRHVPGGNHIHIGAFDKRKAVEHYRRSNDVQALQWLDKAYQPRGEIKPGAGQIRVESRLAFHFRSAAIRERLKQLVQTALEPNITWRQNTPPYFYVYLYSTLAGGTGSGSFLLMAYLIQDVIRSQGWQPRVIGNLMLSTLMMNKVSPDLHPDIHANTYAALKELEHLTKLQYPAVHQARPEGEEFVFWNNPTAQENPRVLTSPFFLSFIFDDPRHVSIANAEEVVADASFLQVFTPIIDNLAGELDNYEKNLTELTRFPGELRNLGTGFSKHFGAFGVAALVVPAADLLEYSAMRFAAEALRRQITFGVDSASAGDRARALERHQVDYDDPQFRNLSEEDRYRRINEAFVNSVQELARQDERDEMTGGYWYRLVDDVDRGRITGADEQGNPQRAESVLARIRNGLDEQRKRVVTEVSIRDRAFVFQREGFTQYIELVSRLKEDIRTSRIKIEEGKTGLETSAAEGEAIADLKLDPIYERYVVLRLLDSVDRELLPAAEKQLKQSRERSIEHPPVREQLENVIFQNLKDAAEAKKWGIRHDDEGFMAVRNDAQAYYQGVSRAQTQLFDAEIRIAQLKRVRDYLTRRAKMYARLATRMNRLVHELEAEAESLRRGQGPVEPRLALRVEILETLEEPKQRLWPQVYDELYIKGGKDLTTFDREILSTCITEQLKPKQAASGRFVEKADDELVADLRRAMLELGRTRLSGAIYGDNDTLGLNLERGLELEARILLDRSDLPASQSAVDDYVAKKLVAVSQLAGVLARVSTEVSEALDDGTKVTRTRQVVLPLNGVSEKFLDRVRKILSKDGANLTPSPWYNNHLSIVHDVELPIPLYYFEPVVGLIEDAYEDIVGVDNRSYNLHTDFHWEHALPNLNPRKSELTVGWSLRTMLDGMFTRVIRPLETVESRKGKRTWCWFRGETNYEVLGQDLSETLYKLGEYHNHPDIGPHFEKSIRDKYSLIPPSDVRGTAEKLRSWFEEELTQIGLRNQGGETSREDNLEQPILRVLRDMVQKLLAADVSRSRTQNAGAAGQSAWPL